MTAREIVQFLFGTPAKSAIGIDKAIVEQQPIPKESFKAPPKPQPSLEEQQHAAFLRALDLVHAIAEKRSVLPILGTVLLQDGKMSATDLEAMVEVSLPWLRCEPLCVPIEALRKLAKKTAAPLSLATDGDKLRFNGATIFGYDATEFPRTIEDQSGSAIGGAFPIPRRWADVLVAAATDESRPNLCGVCLDFARGRLVATNGHRLHALNIESVDLPQVIVPLKVARIVEKLLRRGNLTGALYQRVISGTTEQAVGAPLLRISGADISLWTQTIDQEFPDYPQVLNAKNHHLILEFPKKELLEALEACLVVTTERQPGVKVVNHGTAVSIEFESPNQGSVVRHVPCKVHGDEWQMGKALGINCRYAIEATSAVQGKSVTMRLKDEKAPVHFLPTDNSADGELQTTVMLMNVFDTPQQASA